MLNERMNEIAIKRYDDFRRTIIKDCIDTVLDTIAKIVIINDKNKKYTHKKLNECVNYIINLIKESKNDLFPNHLFDSLKPKISDKLVSTFCYKRIAKSIKNETIEFSTYIENSIEISSDELKNKDLKLDKFNIFEFPLEIEGKKYLIIYGEENKFSKRKILEVTLNNVIVDPKVIPKELKDKYDFM